MSNKPNTSPQQQTRAHGEQEPSRDQIQERAYYRYVERVAQTVRPWMIGSSPRRRSAIGVTPVPNRRHA